MATPPDEIYGLPIKQIARVCKVTARTAARWKSGQTVMPYAARVLVAQDLGAFDPMWRNWTLRDGQLISPEGWTFGMREVLAQPLLRAQLAAMKLALKQSREKWEAYEEQPLPGDIPQIQSIA